MTEVPSSHSYFHDALFLANFLGIHKNAIHYLCSKVTIYRNLQGTEISLSATTVSLKQLFEGHGLKSHSNLSHKYADIL